VPIALLAAGAELGHHADDAKRNTACTRAHGSNTNGQKEVGFRTAALGARSKTLTRRHDILRKYVLGTRTRKGGASVKDFAVPR
jgi:hypothetical protein